MTAMLARAQAPPILFLPEIISSRSLSLALSLSISLSASTAYLRTPGCLLLESSSPRSREWKYFPVQRHFCHISLRGNLREVLRSGAKAKAKAFGGGALDQPVQVMTFRACSSSAAGPSRVVALGGRGKRHGAVHAGLPTRGTKWARGYGLKSCRKVVSNGPVGFADPRRCTCLLRHHH